ncbi:FRG domain-containing protein [Pseudomonas sp. RW405]|uniref:FRG domain-containing protein n=1 Tax=Pseudomonas sp. RW405 TaxID=2202652 RepID=UPI000D734D2B|nr:FRG domain-containing protein [Pseudomonas sp. RW405]PWY43395.1 FRG domain-containing protein [Pseudomonas sp. RW405]
MTYVTREANTAEEFLEMLSPMSATWDQGTYVFRGQCDANFGLTPSVFRDSKITPVRRFMAGDAVTMIEQVWHEVELLRSFLGSCNVSGLKVPGYTHALHEQINRNKSDLTNVPSLWPPRDFYEVLAVAQHHGLPTRLLDWTRRSYVAAYFAGSSALEQEDVPEYIAVWALNIAKSHEWDSVAVVDMPGGTSINLAAQSGLFTLPITMIGGEQPFTARPLEQVPEIYEHNPYGLPLIRYKLPYRQVPRLLELCNRFGVSGATLFPGYEGVARHVKDLGRSAAIRQAPIKDDL